MREIKQIADRITVLRDGRKITTVGAGDVSENELVELMTGRKIGVLFPRIEQSPAEKLLEVENLTLANHSVNNVSFYARAGEITGIAGLVGCGKSELIRAVYRSGGDLVRNDPRQRGSGDALPDRAVEARSVLFALRSGRRRPGAEPAGPRERVDGGARSADILAGAACCNAGASGARFRPIVEKLKLRPPSDRAGGRQPFRRQSPEGLARARADARHFGVSVRRTDRGHRRRRQDRGL